MSLEGLRAWIGEVERKLEKRTRVFLALAVIAIGIAGASVYLAIDARNSSVSEADVQELQQQLEAQIDEAATSTPGAAAEPVEPTEPEADSVPREPKPKSGSSRSSGTGGVGTGAPPAAAGTDAPSNSESARIQELLEQAEAQNAEAEEGTNGK